MGNLFEVFMMICFGASWPINLMKAYRSKTAKGISLAFLCLIEVGYIFGILAKVLNGNITYVLFFYFLNIFLVAGNIVVYFRNKKYDRELNKTNK